MVKIKDNKEMASGIWTALHKIAVNTASSAAGTGAVLGMHSAMAPDPASPATGWYQPTAIEEKGLVNFQFRGATSFYVISALALLLGICFACCCSPRACSTSFWRKRRADRKLENEVADLTRRLEANRKEPEDRMEDGLGEGGRTWRSQNPRPRSPSDPTLGAPRY